MIKKLSKISKIYSVWVKLDEAITSAGGEVRLVGGSVRDMIIGQNPKDFDFATTLTPDKVTNTCIAHGYKVIPTGIDHGTVTVIIDETPLEVTTLRKDVETDGRHAKVEFTDDWEEDAARRDFTINAMFMSLDGTLHDYYGGEYDLIKGIVRFVGNPEERIKEDYLRILRYFRMISRYGYDDLDIHSSNLDIISILSPGLHSVSGERIWSELNKLNWWQGGFNLLHSLIASNVAQTIFIGNKFDNNWFVKNSMIYERLLSREETNPLSYMSLFMKHQEDVDMIKSVYKIDNNSYKTLSFLVSNGGFSSKLTMNKLNEFIALGQVSIEDAYTFAKIYGTPDEVDFYDFFDRPIFPVKGGTLLDMGYSGKEIGQIIRDMKISWANSMFEKTEEELLNELKN